MIETIPFPPKNESKCTIFVNLRHTRLSASAVSDLHQLQRHVWGQIKICSEASPYLIRIRNETHLSPELSPAKEVISGRVISSLPALERFLSDQLIPRNAP